MELENLANVQGDGSIFSGAIFMSNRETKRECLQKKLFALPSSKAIFLKQVKAGMLLFLFEHEERKLFGVFEATSDGALNIIPDAFLSTGNSYPAQVLFKRIWFCKPLFENEFRSAISENYFSPNKFHFGLSYEQVVKLIHLFHLKRIDLKNYEKPGMPHKILEQFESRGLDEVGLAQRGTHLKYKSDEIVAEGKRRESQRYSTQTFLEHPMKYEKLDTSTSNTTTNTGVGSYQADLWTVEPWTSYTPHCNSQTVQSRYESGYTFSASDHLKDYPFSVSKQSLITSDMDRIAIGPEPPQFSTSLDNMGIPYLTDRKNNSEPDRLECMSPFAEYSMLQKMDETHGPDIFLQLDAPKDFYPHSELLGSACYSGAQANEAFQFPDYVHLAQETEHLVKPRNQNYGLGHPEYVPSSVTNSCIPCTGKEVSNLVYFSDEISDEEEPKPYQVMQTDECHPSIMDGKLHANPDTRRTSVFSRLSRDQNVSYQHETLEQSRGLSLNQLLDILSKRREYWRIEEVSQKSIRRDYREQYSGIAAIGQFVQNSEFENPMRNLPIEQTKMTNNHELAGVFNVESNNDAAAEDAFELPFYNFKRRKKTGKFECLDDPNGDNYAGEGMIGNTTKRRKLIRPSLNGDECQNVKTEAEVEMSVEKNSILKETKTVDGDDATGGKDKMLPIVGEYGVKGEAEVEISVEKNLNCKVITNTNDGDDVIDIEVQVFPMDSNYKGKGKAEVERSVEKISYYKDTNETNGEDDIIDREVQDAEVEISVERNSECKDTKKVNDGGNVIVREN